MSDNNILAPVFLQSLWRSCSTYFWNKFRENPEWRCYKEPLHENLGLMRPQSAAQPMEMKSLRHPPLKEHHFAEYDFREEGGVPFFQKRFTAENYVLAPEDSDPGLEQYISGLFNHAANNLQRPMLQPNRAVLRAEWMKHTFPGTHVYLSRDRDMLMRSYYSFHGRESYFLRSYAAIVGKNADHPLFAELAEAKRIERFDNESFQEELKFYGGIVRGWDRQDLRDIVGFIWILGLAQASRYADFVIDASRMHEPDYNAYVASVMSDMTSADLDFTDFRLGKPGDPEDLQLSEDVRVITKEALQKIAPDWARLEKIGMPRSLIQTLDNV